MKKHKYRAKRTEADQIKFDSKKEAKRYLDLKERQKQGEIDFFLRQVPFHLPGNVRYVVDFVIFWSDGTCTFEDVKGYMTSMSKLKIKQVKDCYGVDITIY